jgi:hypothetical protein
LNNTDISTPLIVAVTVGSESNPLKIASDTSILNGTCQITAQ